jgi:hypothetical protein
MIAVLCSAYHGMHDQYLNVLELILLCYFHFLGMNIVWWRFMYVLFSFVWDDDTHMIFLYFLLLHLILNVYEFSVQQPILRPFIVKYYRKRSCLYIQVLFGYVCALFVLCSVSLCPSILVVAFFCQSIPLWWGPCQLTRNWCFFGDWVTYLFSVEKSYMWSNMHSHTIDLAITHG